jgi:hypothetical protein
MINPAFELKLLTDLYSLISGKIIVPPANDNLYVKVNSDPQISDPRKEIYRVGRELFLFYSPFSFIKGSKMISHHHILSHLYGLIMKEPCLLHARLTPH